MKKILVIGLNYHHYTQEIVRECSELGNSVTYRDIQPRDFFTKVLRIVAPRLYKRRLDLAHLAILDSDGGKNYDFVLFIQAHQMEISTLRRLKESLPQAEFVLYNWDALSNHDYRPQLPFFDRAYTFDPVDASQLKINYLPLFCIKAFQNLKRRNQEAKQIYFVGNIVSVQRYVAIQAFKQYCKKEQITFNCYLACTPLVLWRLLLKGHCPWDVTLRSISQSDFINMIETSTTVFDFANHKQAGYTMRTIENLCAGKKIITANSRIMSEEFYSADRMHVFQDMDFSGISEFLNHPLQDPDQKFEKFHLKNFVQTLLGDQTHLQTVSVED